MEETMARKGENIYKRKDGRWEGRYHKINMADGRQKYASVYGKTYKEVKEKLFLKKREQLLEKGGHGCLPTGLTIGEAAGMWLEERRGAWKESTLSTYRSITEKHILPLRKPGILPHTENISKFCGKGNREKSFPSSICTRYTLF